VENYKEKFIDANGTLIVDQAGWSDVTKGRIEAIRGWDTIMTCCMMGRYPKISLLSKKFSRKPCH
jgi:hypothetical protein